jgi:glycosyltransferase involved in cell wall biosynthesis
MIGLPIVALATTEMSTVVENGVSGWIDTNVASLVDRMRDLLADPAEARRLGQGAQRTARERFSIERFVRDWDQAFADVTGGARRPVGVGAASS